MVWVTAGGGGGGKGQRIEEGSSIGLTCVVVTAAGVCVWWWGGGAGAGCQQGGVWGAWGAGRGGVSRALGGGRRPLLGVTFLGETLERAEGVVYVRAQPIVLQRRRGHVHAAGQARLRQAGRRG